MQPGTDDPVWYVAYGSNLLAARFGCYLAGGRPPGARRTYAGCRDRRPPRAARAVRLPGSLTFAGVSTVWGGGLAFYDPLAQGGLAARAYLVTFSQFSDVVAQEARRPVAGDLALGDTATLHVWPSPASVYESVVHLGEQEGFPMLTITSLRDLDPVPPSGAYLRTILYGLAETFGCSVAERVDYVLRAPGVAQGWTRDDLGALCTGPQPGVTPADPRTGPAGESRVRIPGPGGAYSK